GNPPCPIRTIFSSRTGGRRIRPGGWCHETVRQDTSVAHGCRHDLRPRAAEPKGGLLNAATMTSPATSHASVALATACLCARLAADHKARDILVLDMRGQTPLYDFFVLVTGASRRQLHVLTEEIDAMMRGQGEKRLSIEGYEGCKWV